ncbi:OsmC-like protein [Nocardioides scoriae]|uniref:OsmC-like protein n=1 Tax=Nocardioides scoriae TaxID=642780 RepID=A0A1H1RJS4_9ACTN|nr:OsmC family protein [Nocardioides scoriae]SDS35219.1 OsmC-like protein [Nocardioides scoriae]
MTLALETDPRPGAEARGSVAQVLGALADCQVVVYRALADELGIALDGVEVTVSTTPAAGGAGQDVGLEVTLSGPETEERYAELRAAVDARGPVLDLVSH